ncbi:MAG TPA: hypothetical protein PLQ19_10175 [Aeromicrobium sp.]|nr:hypothetical protein [Aeromicrobium sp.]
MSTRIATEEIEATRSEKFLSVLLAAFLLIGAGWTYYKIPGWVEEALPNTVSYASVTAADEKANDAMEKYNLALSAEESAVNTLDLARSEYTLAMAKGEGVPEAKEAYEAAQANQKLLAQETKEKSAQETTARKAAEDARKTYEEQSKSGLRGWITALLLFGLVALITVGSYVLIGRLRERESRYLPLGFACAAVGAVMALVFAVDYITDYIDPLDLGPIVLSILGVVATIVAFRVLQKYLAVRVPGMRVRKGDCPFCGFPLHDSGFAAGHHCTGCGREVIAPCAVCSQPRRVGSRHCAECGAV